MKFGYARVSTLHQNFDLQLDALIKAGVHERNIFKEKVSGIKKRPALQECMDWLKTNDELVVYKLDRLGRSTKDLWKILDDLEKKEVKLVSITEQIDTSTPFGRLIFGVLTTIAGFQRDIIVEMSYAGVLAKKQRGLPIGRPSALHPENYGFIRQELQKGTTVSEIARILKISRSPIYKLLKNGFKIYAENDGNICQNQQNLN